jgi:sialic acid synthase SpsE
MTSKTKTKIICELHPQHRGDINDLESMILQCKMFGGDMVKLQLYDTLKLHGNTDRKHLEITAEELKRINNLCKNINMELFCSVFDEEKIQWCIDLNFKYIKIASRSFKEANLVHKALDSGKKVFISNGFDQKDFKYKHENLEYFYCTPQYPTLLPDIKIPEFTDYSGFSDHTLGITACKIAAQRGAKYIEKHFTLNKNMHIDCEKGHLGSMDYKELQQLKQFINENQLVND